MYHNQLICSLFPLWSSSKNIDLSCLRSACDQACAWWRVLYTCSLCAHAPWTSLYLRSVPEPVTGTLAGKSEIMAAGPASLHQRLETCAANVGYRGRVRGLPKEASGGGKAAHFLQWLCGQLVPANAFSQSELDKWALSLIAGRCILPEALLPCFGRFEEMKKTGVVLEVRLNWFRALC